MGNVIALNRRERRIKAARSRQDGSKPEFLKQRIHELQVELADTRAMLLAIVRRDGRVRVDKEHLIALKEGDTVDAEEDGMGNFLLQFRGG